MSNNKDFVSGPLTLPGTDKLVIQIPAGGFSIAHPGDAGMILKPGYIDLDTGETTGGHLFTDKTGTDYTGNKAILNNPLYQLDVNPYGLKLQFNPSKPYHPHHLCTDADVLQERTERVFDDLSRIFS